MNIAMAFTSNYCKYAKTVIYSLLRNNNNVQCIYIFTDIPVRFSGITCKVVYNTYKQIVSSINSLNKTERYTDAALVKLFLQNTVDVDRILYLDCDVIIDQNISDLYYMDLKGKSALLVEELESKSYSGYSKEGEILDHYYNTGVMVLDLKRLRELDRVPEITRLLNTYSYFLPDQDVFNVIYHDEIIQGDRRYNYHDFDNNLEDVYIYHWAGYRKITGSMTYLITKSG